MTDKKEEKLEPLVKQTVDDFDAIVDAVNNKFGENYASKNPALVTHLLDHLNFKISLSR